MKFNTKTIHGGQSHEASTGAVVPPIFQTSTYAQPSPGVNKGYEYSRITNPSRTALQNAFAAIENGTHGFAFSSGIAAVDCVLRLLSPGDEIIAGKDIYGGSYRMFTQLFQKYGLKFHFADMAKPENVTNVITSNTKLIWLETPSNPLLKIVNIQAIASATKKVNPNILIAVDNTFATPYLQKPLDLGADIIMHSATKYLSGHSDVVIGALIVKNEQLAKDIHFIQYAAGAIAGPIDCFLALRGIKTLHVRMQRHCENAKAVANYLVKHPKVASVYYPGLENHSNHTIAKEQMNDFGGMVSFKLKDNNKEAATQFIENAKLFTLAESLGGVESLMSYPISMSHASLPDAEKEVLGISHSLIRLSIGIEDIDDLLKDLEQALS
ncbi:cystathionine gamma-synthase [Pseudofulvibacter geojedonensis]|uniref:Cystathionine gamma-synthase n=1 Tax=Pseudofulvibacter geojedonensis TaxID=1123758 RepID=A0ABW3I3W9_9FLAO